MICRKLLLLLLIGLFTCSAAFCQTEVLKGVVNNLAFYRQKKDLKYLTNAKKSVDSLITTHADSLNIEKMAYRAVVYSSIIYIDSLNKLNQPAAFFKQTTDLVDKLSAEKKIYKYQSEIDYAKRCLANVYIRKAFVYVNKSDFGNALQMFEKAHTYAPDFKELNAYIAYTNSKLGNLRTAIKYYADLIGTDSVKAEYVEAASNIYKTLGDTSAALDLVKKARRTLPNDRTLLLDEANMYNNKKDYQSLAPLLPTLLDINSNSADVAFVAANCYDRINEYDKAESLYLRAIDLNGSAYDPIFNLGLLYLKQSQAKPGAGDTKNLSLAVQWLERASEISPNDVNCLQVLQLAYTQTGNKDQLYRVNNKLKQINNQ